MKNNFAYTPLIDNLCFVGCNKFKSKRKTGMKIHMKCHTGEKALACPTCGALFATNTKYMDHCNRKMPIRGNYYPDVRKL